MTGNSGVQKNILPQPGNSALETGVLLCDHALNHVGWDQGAMQILHGASGNGRSDAAPPIPAQLQERIRRGAAIDGARDDLILQIGRRIYRCRFYLVASACPTLKSPLVAVFLHSEASVGEDPVTRVAGLYHLTEREQEALRGIALGLSTKELAYRMQISPNTVKSFIRLITVKMGVGSRAEIMVKLLENSTEDRL